MKKFLLGVAATLSCLLAIGGIVGIVSAQSMRTTTPRSQNLQFILHNTAMKFAQSQDVIGNIMVMEDPFYDAQDQNQVGRMNGYCVRTQVGRHWECNGTVVFNDGSQVSWQGPFDDYEASGLDTITGGTGIYDGVHGKFQLIAADTKAPESTSYRVMVTLM